MALAWSQPELRRVAGRRDGVAVALHQVVRHGLPVDGVEDRLPHLLVGERRVVAGAPGGVQLQVAHAHGAGAHGRLAGQALQALVLIGVVVPDPVRLSADQGGQLAGLVQHLDDLQVLDRRAALRAVLVVVLEPFEIDVAGAVHPGDLVGPGADRLLGVGRRADLLAVGFGIDRQRHGEIFQRRGKDVLQLDADLHVAELFRAGHEGEVARHGTAGSFRMVS